jgi:non-ribosomal peptide synthetase component F
LPTDKVVEHAAPNEAARRVVQFSPEITDSLNEFCRKLGCTPFMVFLTALGITLRQWTKQRDLVLGTVVAGRNRQELENVIGCFMTFLPLRLKISDDETGSRF